MCGIAATANRTDAADFVMTALKRLQYRGYDSWGILGATEANDVSVEKYLGAPDDTLSSSVFKLATTAIGHTRWATHGKVCKKNAHPICSGTKRDQVWVVHNGVIENHEELREQIRRGYSFKTDTDTESIAALLHVHQEDLVSLADQCRLVCRRLVGQFAFAAFYRQYRNVVVLAARGSPLYVSNRGYAASDLNALAGYGTKAYRLKDDEVVVLSHSVPPDLKYDEPIPEPTDEEPVETHRMLSEILEQPGLLRCSQFGCDTTLLPPARCVRLFGCGSSYNAALLGRYYLQYLGGIQTFVDYATEITTHTCFDNPDTLWVGLTQSGETKDTLNALEHLLTCVDGKRLFVITNNPLSSAARLATPIALDCGVEHGVAATKTFTVQSKRLLEMSLVYGGFRGFRGLNSFDGIYKQLPDAVEQLIDNDRQIQAAASYVSPWHNILYLARGMLYPVAMEGALKMKEIAYLHAEAMHAAEMKHGPLALIDDQTLSIFLLTRQDEKHIARVLTNMQEVKARKGTVLVFADEHTHDAASKIADHVVSVPGVSPYTQPILVAVALQLLSYYVAVSKGLPVDTPRNLAKCCTVE